MVLLFDSRHSKLVVDLFVLWKQLTIEMMDLEAEFVMVDMADRKMFTFIADTYNLGNFDTPGIFATQGDFIYYRNYERFKTVESFKRIST